MIVLRSFVEGKHPISSRSPPGKYTKNTPETSVMLESPLEDVLMSSVAEWSISTHLAIAELEIATLSHVKGNRSVSGQDPLALSIAPWSVLGVSTTAPVVLLSSVEVNMSWENTGIYRHGSWSISTFLIWS